MAGRLRSLLAGVFLACIGIAAPLTLGHTRPDSAAQQPRRAPAYTGPVSLTPTLPDGRTLRFLGAPATPGGPGAAIATRVTADIGAAADAVDGFWGTDWPREIVVEIADTGTEFAHRTGLAGADIAAAAVADHIDAATHTATGARIVLAPGVLQISEQDFRIVLTHELFHYATRAVTATDTARWVQEGVADHVARPAPAPGTAPVPDRLPTDADFTVTDPGQLSAAYDRAWGFARYLASRGGPERLREFYARAAGPGHPDAGVALTQVFGATGPELLADWRAAAGR
ncbi:MAG: hypothetical protein U0R77_10355 [Mycolicibacterium insubricum]|nr:hypothetical protein [Mycobacterium sp.]